MIFFPFYPKSVTIAHKAIGTALRARQRVDKSSYFHDTVHITNSRDALMNLKVESKAIIVDDGYNQVRDVSIRVAGYNGGAGISLKKRGGQES